MGVMVVGLRGSSTGDQRALKRLSAAVFGTLAIHLVADSN
jgi:hypothetical protein